MIVGSVMTITYITGGFEWITGGEVTPDVEDIVVEGIPEEWVLSPWTATLVKEDAVATKVANADAFVWFDWNQDGVMQRSTFEGIVDGELVNGEIEQLASAATTGVVTSGYDYPIGEYFYFQIVVASYQTEVFKKVMIGSRNFDGSAKSVGNIHIRATDASATDRISTTGAGLLVTSSGDYNYTLYGTTPKLTFRHTAVTTDAGFSSQTHADFDDATSWTHWGNGKVYAATFVGMVMTNQDATDLDPDVAGFWDERIPGATNTIFIKWITDVEDGLFYSSDDSGPAIYEFDFYFDINADGDIASIGVYQDVELDDALIGQWGSAYLGTYETDLDFTA